MDPQRTITLGYAPPSEDGGARRITRLVLVVTMALSSLGFLYGSIVLVVMLPDAAEILTTPFEDWTEVASVLMPLGYALGGGLVLAAGIWMLRGGRGRSGRWLAAGARLQGVAIVLEGAITLESTIRVAGAFGWDAQMSYMGPILAAPLTLASGCAIAAAYFAKFPTAVESAVRRLLIGAAILGSINVAEAVVTLPAQLVMADASGGAYLFGPQFWFRQRPFTLSLGGIATVLAMVGSLLRPHEGWRWPLRGGLALQAAGLALYCVMSFRSAAGHVERQGVSFETLSTFFALISDDAAVLLLSIGLALLAALPQTSEAMRRRGRPESNARPRAS